MSDPEPLALDDSRSTPKPDPAPLAAPARRTSRAALALAAALTGLVLLTVIVYAVVAPKVGSFIDPLWGSELAGWVWWSGEGEYAIAQLYDDEQPYVIVWTRSDGSIRRQDTVRIVAVEPGGRVWLVPDDGTGGSPDYYEPPDVAGDASDSAPERLLLWDLRSAVGPSDDAESRWAPITGPGGRTAYLEVDAVNGALPRNLIFQPSSGEGEGVKAQLPEDLTTFEPLGWSPSGEYFAICSVPTIQPDEDPEHVETTWIGETRRMIVAASTGKVVASENEEIDMWDVSGSRGVWDADEDLLYFVSVTGGEGDSASGDPAERYHTSYLSPAGMQGPAMELDGWRDPEILADSLGAELIGATEDGVVLRIDGDEATEIWTAGRSSERLGGLPEGLDLYVDASSYSASSGLAVLELAERPKLHVVGLNGMSKTVWEAE